MKSLLKIFFLTVCVSTMFCVSNGAAMRWRPQVVEGRYTVSEDAELSFTEVARFDVSNANQGIGVDEKFFYAINNTVITKHDKTTGEEVDRWDPENNPLFHLDSAMVKDGKLYCAHSNYPQWPMTSSIEVWDTATMEHIGSHSFGIRWGSCTWLDYYQGHWWATFANYNKLKNRPDPADPDGFDVAPGDEENRVSIEAPYGYKRNTTMVKFTEDWQAVEAWILPDEILQTEKTGNMSNSGGSWGPDGYLYLTGHDLSEVFRVKLPDAGSILTLVETIPLQHGEEDSIRGQGIAWDRSGEGLTLYGIIRATKDEKKQGISHKVTASKLSIVTK